jgi:hypothetical protein
MWHTKLRKETYNRMSGQDSQDLADIGHVQFDKIDEFDLIKEGCSVFIESGDGSNQEEHELNEKLYVSHV